MARSYNAQQVLDDDRLKTLEQVYNDSWQMFVVESKRLLYEIYEPEDVDNAFHNWNVWMRSGVTTQRQVRCLVMTALRGSHITNPKMDWVQEHDLQTTDEWTCANT
jgi:hypothetical protein